MGNQATPDNVLGWMVSALSDGDFIDRRTGEVNYTAMAEGAANAFGQDQWLDDPDHWVWDLAIEAEDYE